MSQGFQNPNKSKERFRETDMSTLRIFLRKFRSFRFHYDPTSLICLKACNINAFCIFPFSDYAILWRVYCVEITGNKSWIFGQKKKIFLKKGKWKMHRLAVSIHQKNEHLAFSPFTLMEFSFSSLLNWVKLIMNLFINILGYSYLSKFVAI